MYIRLGQYVEFDAHGVELSALRAVARTGCATLVRSVNLYRLGGMTRFRTVNLTDRGEVTEHITFYSGPGIVFEWKNDFFFFLPAHITVTAFFRAARRVLV